VGLFISTLEDFIASSPTNPDCIHHWDIEASGNPTSTGVCRGCGQTREFENFIPLDTDYSWLDVAHRNWQTQYGTEKPEPRK